MKLLKVIVALVFCIMISLSIINFYLFVTYKQPISLLAGLMVAGTALFRWPHFWDINED